MKANPLTDAEIAALVTRWLRDPRVELLRELFKAKGPAPRDYAAYLNRHYVNPFSQTHEN